MTHSSNSNSAGGTTTASPSSRSISRTSASASAPVTPSSGFNIPHSQTTPKISTFTSNDFSGSTSATTAHTGSATASSSISPPILATFSPSSLSPRNSIISTNANAAARYRSLSTTGHNYTTSNLPSSSSKRSSFSEFSNEQIIDLMEREQDAIVLKLMREIELLKQENKMLKMNNHGSSSVPLPISSPPSVRRSSSLSTNGSRSSSSSSKRTSMFGNYSFRENSTGQLSQIVPVAPPAQSHSTHSPTTTHDDIIKKYKSEAFPITRRLSLNGKYEEIMDENRNLKREIKRLQNELENLKK